ncbi:MAG: RAMP superfamily CRISPR-associated protein [Promethearchaeota archaeon]
MVNFKIDIIAKLELNKYFHTTGERLEFGIDKAIYIDPKSINEKEKILLIPATSIKGLIRSNVETILRLYNKNICKPPRPENMCNDKNNSCIICRIFGSPKIKSPLIFTDALVSNSIIDNRIGISIDRYRKITKEQQLFSYEIGYGIEILIKINGVFNNEYDALNALALIYLGIKSSFALGGLKSRGLGWFKLKTFNARVNENEISLDKINSIIREVLS